MRVNNFSVQIPQGVERDNQLVEVPHGTPFAVVLGNHRDRRCDATLTVDGAVVGVFRLGPNERLTVEGPPDDPAKGRFTFYRADSADGAAAGAAGVARADRGRVTVRFQPEYRLVPRAPGGGVLRSVNLCSAGPAAGPTCYAGPRGQSAGQDLAAGVTGLSGRTDQAWRPADEIDHDPAGEVVIHLRLAVPAAVPAVRPLAAGLRSGPVETAVPAPVE